MEMIAENKLTYELFALTPLRADTAEDAIRQLGGYLFQQGIVRDTYVGAVLQREEIFPTGLPTPGIHVAIPHTDPEHVKKPAIAIGILEKPVVFGEMGNPDSQLDVQLICMLAIAKSDSLITLLEKLVVAFQDPEFLQSIISCDCPEQAIMIFNSKVPVL
jgi:galactitol PTS system EIIA component